jgi:hypothetical protein
MTMIERFKDIIGSQVLTIVTLQGQLEQSLQRISQLEEELAKLRPLAEPAAPPKPAEG